MQWLRAQAHGTHRNHDCTFPRFPRAFWSRAQITQSSLSCPIFVLDSPPGIRFRYHDRSSTNRLHAIVQTAREEAFWFRCPTDILAPLDSLWLQSEITHVGFSASSA